MTNIPTATSPSGGDGAGNVSGQTARRYIRLNSHVPFSDGVMVGNTLYLSGRIGLDASGKRVPDDIETEARNLMNSVQDVLQKVDLRLDDLVYVQVFCSDVSLWDRFNAIYSSYFQDNVPARAFIGASKLLFDAHFELQGIAIRSSAV